MYDLIVIGAGPGGYEAAAHAGHLGKRVALIEREAVGGTCLNVGCIPAKTFLRSARLYHECADAAAFGVRLGSLEFDMQAVVERKNRVVGTLVKGVDGLLKRAKVEVVRGQARIVARDKVQVGSDILEGANILIATGSRPAVPPITGIRSERVVDSDSVFDLQAIPATVGIIGGGYIGLELASFFSAVGSHVTVYEMLPQIAAGCDEDTANYLQRSLKRSGVTFNLSCRVQSIEGDTLRYSDSAGSELAASADLFLNATGRSPVVDDLGLESLGVDFSKRGIPISDQGRTNVPGIWACGDVTGRHMLAHVATREGLVAVNTMFGRPERIRYNAIPAVIYTHPEAAMVGKTEQELRSDGIAYRKSLVPMAVAGRFLIENEGGTGFVKVLAGAKYGEVLGVHAVGDSCSEFIVAAATMVESEFRLAEAREIVFPHPTVSEALREAILQVG